MLASLSDNAQSFVQPEPLLKNKTAVTPKSLITPENYLSVLNITQNVYSPANNKFFVLTKTQKVDYSALETFISINCFY